MPIRAITSNLISKLHNRVPVANSKPLECSHSTILFFSFLCFLLYLRPYFYNDKQESISGPFVHAVPGENLEPFPSTHFDGFAALWTLSTSDKKEGR